MKKLIIIGAGGHSKTCLEVVQSSKIYKVIGFIDNKTKFDDFFKKFKIFNENKLNIALKITKNVHIGIGQIKSPKLRVNLFKKYKKKEFKFPVIIHSSAYISKYSLVNEGTLVGIDSVVNANCKIG